jgi:hypothetical protein
MCDEVEAYVVVRESEESLPDMMEFDCNRTSKPVIDG